MQIMICPGCYHGMALSTWRYAPDGWVCPHCRKHQLHEFIMRDSTAAQRALQQCTDTALSAIERARTA